MTEMRDDSEREDKFRVADEPQAEECRATHAPLRVVEEAVDTGVGELRRDLLGEEEVGVEPA